MKTRYLSLTHRLSGLSDIPFLLLRLVLAYGFFGPALMKLGDIDAITGWFQGLGIPLPALNAYLATFTELIGAVGLLLGFGTRLVCIPLIITMLVAIKTVHWVNGFEAGDNGYEIPLYYLVMLLCLLFMGPGRISLDAWFRKRLTNATPSI